jgi:hypothetical protein
MAAPETWTADECAAAWGIKVGTWRDYVARGYAPQPLPGYDEQRRRRWDPEKVRDRPAKRQGARNDLRPTEETT